MVGFFQQMNKLNIIYKKIFWYFRSDTVFPSDEGLTSNIGRHFRDARLFLLGTSTSTVTATATSTTTTYKGKII